jgi:hypothetical protein
MGIPYTVYVRNVKKLKCANKASLAFSIMVLGMSLHIHRQPVSLSVWSFFSDSDMQKISHMSR